MVAFTDEDKAVREYKDKLPFGVTKVHITGILADQTEAGKDFIEVGVENQEEVQDAARLWFVGGAINISFNTIRDILVHNQATEEEKEAMRQKVDATTDHTELAILLQTIEGGEAWFTKYLDPTRTYQDGNGVTRRSVNSNILGYEPRLKPELMPKADSSFDDLKAEDLPDGEADVPFKSEGDAKPKIPRKW